MTKLSRWVGMLEVLSKCYQEETPLFYPENDPYVVRFKVRALVWLPKEKTVPIREKTVWERLSFTNGHDPNSSAWTGKLRTSLNKLPDEDGSFLENLLLAQQTGGQSYAVDEEKYKKLLHRTIRRADKVVAVVVPEDEDEEDEPESADSVANIRESAKAQAILAACGERMGFKIWLPKNDRSTVLTEWKPQTGSLVDVLPLNYDTTTLDTIESIDVLWLKGRSIARAFEVEHTTAVYSGILRMADLLALQPNMDIKLHIVAPELRRKKVFSEIQRPVFSLLDKGPLSEYCTFLSYDSLKELSELRHLQYVSDAILDEFAETAKSWQAP